MCVFILECQYNPGKQKRALRVLENLKEERYSNRTRTVCLGEKADEREGQRKVKVKDK